MTTAIRTVLGDLSPALAGVVDSHDHLFLSTPALSGEELDGDDAATSELAAFGEAGGGTVVQWTPRGLKRGLPALRDLSGASGIHIVAATGRHRRPLYGSQSSEPNCTEAELVDAFVSDVVDNACGLIKIGVSYETVTVDEADALRAAATAHHTTGVPIAIHLEQGSAAEFVLDILFAESVPPQSIVLGHLGRNPNVHRIMDAAQSGTWLCLDSPSPRHPGGTDDLAHILALLIDNGHMSQLLLGADTTTASSRSEPVGFGPAGLLVTQLPRLRDLLGAEAVTQMTIDNPARAWSMSR